MAEVSLSIHGKSYGVACDEGQEDRVREVGRYVDSRVRDIASAGAASNENHILVLAALVLADEVKELQDGMQALQAELEEIQTRPETVPDQGRMTAAEEQQVIQAIDHLKGRLDSVAGRLQEL